MILEKIRTITKEQTQKMIFLGLAIMIFILPIPQCIWPDEASTIAMQATFLMLLGLYFGVIYLIEIYKKRVSLKKQGLAYLCIYGLFLVGIISVLISQDKSLALYGPKNRSEGFLTLISYYFIFIAASLLENKTYRQRILQFFLLLGSIVTVLGILQYTLILEMKERFPGMAYVPMRNPNFYAAFAILFVGIGIGGFLTYREDLKVTHPFRWWNRAFWYVLILFGYAACICASSSVVYVGLIMIFLMSFFLEIVTKRRRFLSLLLLVVGLVTMMILFDLIRGGSVSEEFFSVGNQIQESGSVFADSVGTNRMGAWRRIVALLPEHWLFGCGIEQLGRTYLDKYGWINGTYFDKAHNEYLHLWITEGIFAVLFYLVFLFALFLPGILQFMEKFKKKIKIIEEKYVFDEITQIVFLAFFGYIAQAFFNISVVQVAPYFWMMCGLLYSRKREAI